MWSDPVTLVIRHPDGEESRYDLDPGIYPIGSDTSNRIEISGSEIAWRHAILAFTPEGVWVEDLNSPGGTFVNGERIQGRVALHPRSVVRVGRFQLIVQPESHVEAAPPPAPPAPAEARPAKAEPPAPEPAAAAAREASRPEAGERKASPSERDVLRAVKKQIQEELLKRLELKRLTASRIGEKDLRERVQQNVQEIVRDVRGRLPPGIDPVRLTKDIYDEAVGLGPLEDLLADADITEIMVNGPDHVYIERAGKLTLTDRSFFNDDSVHAIIERIVAPIGRRIDESQPYVDARLPDGSRVNAIIHPLSLSGPCLTIRKFSKDPFTVADLVRFGSLAQPIADFLDAAVRLRKNMVVSGGTGTGKTTLLNVISSFIPSDERIVTIEDAAELRLGQEHVIRLEARPPNIEGKGAITIRDLVRNALRMRPDRIVVGEVRGGEALDMLQAMNTGHEGSLTTVHANSPRDVVSRLETMVLMSNMDLPVKAIREQIGAAIHMIVHIQRFSDGTRKVARVAEVTGLEGEQLVMQDIFTFQQTGVNAQGRVVGQFRPTGSVPTFVEEMAARGVTIDHRIFDPMGWR